MGIIVIISLLLVACAPQINEAPAEEAREEQKQEPVKVIYNFEPDDPTMRSRYRMYTWRDDNLYLEFDDSESVPLSWVKAANIRIGSKYRCVRSELRSGACTPVIHYVMGLLDSWNSWKAAN